MGKTFRNGLYKLFTFIYVDLRDGLWHCFTRIREFAGSSNWHLKWEGHRKWDFEVGTSHRTRGVHGKKVELSSKPPPLIPRFCIQISQNIEWNLDVWSFQKKYVWLMEISGSICLKRKVIVIGSDSPLFYRWSILVIWEWLADGSQVPKNVHYNSLW
jgi:hypothetical protein